MESERFVDKEERCVSVWGGGEWRRGEEEMGRDTETEVMESERRVDKGR